METISWQNDTLSWVLFGLCAFLMGLSKTGIPNVGTLTIPIVAYLFGAKESTGVILPLLCIADTIAIAYYRRKFDLKPILPLLPWSLIGLVFALLLGHSLDSSAFGLWMGACLLGSVVWLLWAQLLNKEVRFPQTHWINALFGLLIGFTSMLGNAAGPVVALFLLSSRIDKYQFVACSVWLLMILNFIKLPLQWLVWDNIHYDFLIMAIKVMPLVLIGGMCGIWLIRRINEARFRQVTLWMIVIASLFLFR
jgi:uncharacterized membrane protein YfcA